MHACMHACLHARVHACINLKHPALTQEWSANHSTRFRICNASHQFSHFRPNHFFNFWKWFVNKVIVWDQKTILFDMGKLAFEILNDFKNFENLTKFHKERPKNIIIGKVPLSSGEQIIIWLQILRGNCCLKNEYEQIYLLANIYSSKSYQLTSVLANLRNRRFYEIADPGVECFAPFSKIFKICHFSLKKKNFRKSFVFFRRANNYSTADSKRQLLPQKWVCTDLLAQEYL